MINVLLRNHDYKYEIGELIKLFTSEFKFIEDEYDKNNLIINTLNLDNEIIKSNTYYYENGILTLSHEEECNLYNQNDFEIKKQVKSVIKRSIFSVLDKIYKSYVPWGILTGIRPVKILHNLIDENKSDDVIRDILKNKYFIKDEKIDLSLDIAKRERKFIYPVDQNKISLYVSIPFCPTRCVYCSFPSNSLKQYGHLKREYVNALKKEIVGLSQIVKDTNKEIETLYIGGGTPTTLDEIEMDMLISSLYENFDLSNIKEFTVEAGRPDTITKSKLEVLKNHGVSRISINPQTMNDDTLVKIGRDHKVADIISKFYEARSLGFDNINMDIILGLIDEDINMVQNTLEQIKKLSPENLTVHTMAIKRASNLKENLDKYELTRYEEMIKMIDLSMEYSNSMNLNPYYMYRQKHMLGNLENIGYAKDGYECIYNMQIMEEKQSNYALGAGSISKFVYLDEDRIERVDNVKNVEQYISRVDEMVERKKKEVFKNVD